MVVVACSPTNTIEPIVTIKPFSRPINYWSVQSLQTSYPIQKIEVAGTYQEIGYSLGKWYQAKGYTPRILSIDEKEKGRALLAFYDEINPSIRQQLQGVYRAYGLELETLDQGIPIWEAEGIRILLPGMVEPESCSVVYARPGMSADGHARFGRNHDWPEKLSEVSIVFTDPEGGYPTVVMNNGTLGFSASDGMNSQGLAFGLASVSNVGYVTPEGATLPSNAAYRLVLENSASVEEAIAMLRSIPVSFVNADSATVISHILLADRSGNSAVVEFLPEGMVVSRTDTPYQVMTNSYWAGPADQPSCTRYQTAVKELESKKGKVDDEGFLSVMSSLQGSTQWSIVYDLDDLSLILTLPASGEATRFEYSLADFISRMEER